MKRTRTTTPPRHSDAFNRLWRAAVVDPRGWRTRPCDAVARAMRAPPTPAPIPERPAAAAGTSAMPIEDCTDE